MCRAGNGAAPPFPSPRVMMLEVISAKSTDNWPNRGYFGQTNGYFGHITDILAISWIFWPEPQYFGPIPSTLAKPIAPSPHSPPQPPSSSLLGTGEAVAAPFAGGETEAPSSKAAESRGRPAELFIPVPLPGCEILFPSAKQSRSYWQRAGARAHELHLLGKAAPAALCKSPCAERAAAGEQHPPRPLLPPPGAVNYRGIGVTAAGAQAKSSHVIALQEIIIVKRAAAALQTRQPGVAAEGNPPPFRAEVLCRARKLFLHPGEQKAKPISLEHGGRRERNAAPQGLQPRGRRGPHGVTKRCARADRPNPRRAA
ncbi:uncharacterized protein LOC116237257 isoform X1 [Phasianus colchicus]|uniref:uncharacterized protein LOC116237257 isoform X1 n=1 Tax=Phasianus colchicus TaxID=9054 RepID=UPI00129E6D38|nr:uncharacterized protein LOC116237257 isoform X1 [Phasianus colchicus]XP_031462164.1 uncharacterized protein LOC116237257 isoform X1 [Phasianus colchicus]